MENYGNADYNLALAEVKAQVKVMLSEAIEQHEIIGTTYEIAKVDAFYEVIEILESMEA